MLSGNSGAEKASRIPGHNGPGRNVFCHYAAGTDGRPLANDHAAQDGGARADGGPAFDGSRNALPVRLGLRSAIGVGCARKAVVDERDSMTNENLVFDGHPLA